MRHSAVVVVCVGLAASCTACGGPATPPPSAAASRIGSGEPQYEVTTEKVGDLGSILVDGHGFALYIFVPDNHSSHSTCTGICAAAWPPVTLPAGVATPLAGAGVETALLGTALRSGATQVTYNGWPLYRWANDFRPGEATGEGLNNVGGLWYVINSQGQPVH